MTSPSTTMQQVATTVPNAGEMLKDLGKELPVGEGSEAVDKIKAGIGGLLGN